MDNLETELETLETTHRSISILCFLTFSRGIETEHWREMSHQYRVTVWIKVGNQRAVTCFARLEKR